MLKLCPGLLSIHLVVFLRLIVVVDVVAFDLAFTRA